MRVVFRVRDDPLKEGRIVQSIQKWITQSWKAFMPVLVAALWTLAAQFVDALSAGYDGGQTWIVAALSSVAVWFKSNAN